MYAIVVDINDITDKEEESFGGRNFKSNIETTMKNRTLLWAVFAVLHLPFLSLPSGPIHLTAYSTAVKPVKISPSLFLFRTE